MNKVCSILHFKHYILEANSHILINNTDELFSSNSTFQSVILLLYRSNFPSACHAFYRFIDTLKAVDGCDRLQRSTLHFLVALTHQVFYSLRV